jgi:hypothetical protein
MAHMLITASIVGFDLPFTASFFGRRFRGCGSLSKHTTRLVCSVSQNVNTDKL